MTLRLPKKLFIGYKYLKKSRLVLKNATDQEALSYFQNILNEAQPQTPEEKTLHKFWRGLYNVNRRKVLSLIRSERSFEPLLLWTESRAIVNSLGLKGVVYIRWTDDNLYEVTKFVSNANNTDAQTEHPITTEYKNQDVKTQQQSVESDSNETSTPYHTTSNTTPHVTSNSAWTNRKNVQRTWAELQDEEDDNPQ